MGYWANISDKFDITFYTWIVIHGYGRTMASGPVERLESREISLIKPMMRFTATTTHQIRASGYFIGHYHYRNIGCYRSTEISVCFVTMGVNGM